MKSFNKLFYVALAGMALCLTTSALADSFNCTNTIGGGTSTFGWPTNTFGTNGLPQGTGGVISLASVNDNVGFYYSGYGSASGTGSNIVFGLVRAWCDQPPSIAANVIVTNITSTSTNYVTNNFNTFEATPSIILAVPISSGSFTWGTNLSKELLAGANWIGIYGITNQHATVTVTNSATMVGTGAGINSKISKVMLR